MMPSRLLKWFFALTLCFSLAGISGYAGHFQPGQQVRVQTEWVFTPSPVPAGHVISNINAQPQPCKTDAFASSIPVIKYVLSAHERQFKRGFDHFSKQFDRLGLGHIHKFFSYQNKPSKPR